MSRAPLSHLPWGMPCPCWLEERHSRVTSLLSFLWCHFSSCLFMLWLRNLECGIMLCDCFSVLIWVTLKPAATAPLSDSRSTFTGEHCLNDHSTRQCGEDSAVQTRYDIKGRRPCYVPPVTCVRTADGSIFVDTESHASVTA